MPYDLFWHLNPTKLQPFREAYQKRLEVEEYARWRSGMYVMQAVGACFGGEYPKQPIEFEKQNGSYADDTEDDEENYTEEEIQRARERFIAGLVIQESRNKREKAREQRMRLREQQEGESE